MKRLIRILFFILVELWFIETLLVLVLPQSVWGQFCFLSYWFYYLWVLLALIVPAHYYLGEKKNEWLWTVMYYQLVILAPFVFLAKYLSI